ncbi:MAG: hypothetical protein SH856_11820 [Flavobacteriales bacterium]|nr:hypothetical protein [Flavobacteriales bacterium]
MQFWPIKKARIQTRKNGSAIGQLLVIECVGTLITLGCTLIDEDIQKIEIAGDCVMSAEDTITLIWNGTLYM